MFAQGHSHAPRVRALLEAAQLALGGSSWVAHELRPVGLELTVVEPTFEDTPSDATNYLGGVADVLQGDRINADLRHLGVLARTALYENDRQIREVRYSVVRGERPGYHASVWVL